MPLIYFLYFLCFIIQFTEIKLIFGSLFIYPFIKIINKAFKTTQRLWLLNMRIDIKSYRAECSPPFVQTLIYNYKSCVNCIEKIEDKNVGQKPAFFYSKYPIVENS